LPGVVGVVLCLTVFIVVMATFSFSFTFKKQFLGPKNVLYVIFALHQHVLKNLMGSISVKFSINHSNGTLLIKVRNSVTP